MTTWNYCVVVTRVSRNRKYEAFVGLHESSTLSITLKSSLRNLPLERRENTGNKRNGTDVRIFEDKNEL